MSLSTAIKAEARRLGFTLVGITTPEPPPHLDVYRQWLEAGRHGGMDYLASERALRRRADPRQILPGCRSILVLGVPYPDPGPVQSSDPGSGQIAAYAWGHDYHEILPIRLRSLIAYIETRVEASIPHRIYTDTGPLLERELAQRAGLGWIGKNTCLINPQQGSYFFLAEILLDLDLELDDPFAADRCGSCTRCLDACPTGCILPDRTLDARRCISYLTIELKTAIPADLRPLTGSWVFGCDICQQVCPWNRRFSRHPESPEFASLPETYRPILVEELALSPQAFNLKFKGSPLKRAKRRGYLRNVATALGNARLITALEPLGRTLLEETEPLVRAHAAWALGQTGATAAQPYLDAAWESETNPEVRSEIQSARQNLDTQPPDKS